VDWKPPQLYFPWSAMEFLCHLTLFPKFSVELFAFQKFNNFRIFWKLSQEISFVPVSKFSEYFVEWKAPMMSHPVKYNLVSRFPLLCFPWSLGERPCSWLRPVKCPPRIWVVKSLLGGRGGRLFWLLLWQTLWVSKPLAVAKNYWGSKSNFANEECYIISSFPKI